MTCNNSRVPFLSSGLAKRKTSPVYVLPLFLGFLALKWFGSFKKIQLTSVIRYGCLVRTML